MVAKISIETIAPPTASQIRKGDRPVTLTRKHKKTGEGLPSPASFITLQSYLHPAI